MQVSKYSFFWLFTLVLLSSCSGKKRVAPSNGNSDVTGETGIFSGQQNTNAQNVPDDAVVHQVEVLELLNTAKYTYLKVKENDEPYWIATMKDDFKVGDTFLYRGGLLKTNFHSDEYDRIFEKLYLVSEIARQDGEDQVQTNIQEEEVNTSISKDFKKPDIKDLVDLSDLVSSPEQYKDKTVKVYGEVVKINPDIMDRNWLHIKDGTADNFDFVITSQTFVPVGHAMVFEGSIALDKDFGAGYAYTIIMENAKPLR